MPMIVMGIFIPLFLKAKSWKGIASIFIGLGVIFLGIGYMKEGFETLKEGIDLAQYAMAGYAGIFVYVLVGSIATVVIQSSSATMAIIITALATGQIDYANALALAIGANVGTTITAIIGAMSSNIEGKRLAGAHLIFKVITGLIAIVFIHQIVYLVDWVSMEVGIAADDHTLKLAVFHTVFNVIGVVVMVPFIGKLVTFLEATLKVGGKQGDKSIDVVRYLNNSVLELPDTAMASIVRETRHLYENAFEIITHGLNLQRRHIVSSMDLEEVIKQPYGDVAMDIDDYYNRKVKGIYGDIIDFSTKAQANMDAEFIAKLYKLKLANRDIVEAVKDTKHLQKNLIKYTKSTNEDIKKQYNFIRQDLAELLRNINIAATTDEEDIILLLLSKAKVHMEKYDILGNGTLDRLIREGLVTNEMATSLMNDSAYAYDISKNLIAMAEILFLDSANEMMNLTGEEFMVISNEEAGDLVDKKEA